MTLLPDASTRNTNGYAAPRGSRRDSVSARGNRADGRTVLESNVLWDSVNTDSYADENRF